MNSGLSAWPRCSAAGRGRCARLTTGRAACRPDEEEHAEHATGPGPPLKRPRDPSLSRQCNRRAGGKPLLSRHSSRELRVATSTKGVIQSSLPRPAWEHRQAARVG